MQSTTNDFFPTAEEKHFFYSALTNVPIESQSFPSTSEGHPPFPSSTLEFGNASDPGFMSHTLENPSLPWSTTPFNPPIPFSPNPHTSFCPPLPLPPSNSFIPFNPPIPLSPIPYASFYAPPPLPNSSTSFGPPLPLPSSSNSSIVFNPRIPSAPIPYTSLYPHLPFPPYTLFNSPIPSSSNTRSFYPPLPPNSSIPFGPSLPLPSPNPPTSFGPPLPLPPPTNSSINSPTPSFPTLAPQDAIPVQGPPVPTRKKRSLSRQKSGSAIPSTHNQRRKLLKELKRCEALQNDEYILAFTGTTVTCAGCTKVLKLDSRDGAWYYPGFWHKHKRRCQSVKDMVSHFYSP